MKRSLEKAHRCSRVTQPGSLFPCWLSVVEAPLLPISTPALILTMLSHLITQVLTPLFKLAYPPLPSPAPSKTPPSTSHAKIYDLPSDTPTPQQQHAKPMLADLLLRVFALALGRPMTDVGKLVRDGGIVRGVLRMAIGLGWDTEFEEHGKVEDVVLSVLDS